MTRRTQTAGLTGLGLALLSGATFGTSGTFASGLVGAGWTPAAAVTARVSVAALVLTAPAVWQLRGRWHLLRRGAGMVLAFGLIAVAGCQLCFFEAVQRLPVGVALLLEYLGTILVVGWMWLAHQQRPRRLTVAGGVLAIAGLVLVLDLTGSVRLDPVGVVWGLVAAVGLAVFFVLSSRAEAPLPPLAMSWAAMVVGAAVLAVAGLLRVVPMAASTGSVPFLRGTVPFWVPVLGLSLVAAVVAYVAGIAAARRLGAKVASFVGLSEVLFAILFAWLLLGQLPTGLQALGGALIVAGIALVRLDELRGVPGQVPVTGAVAPSDDTAEERAA